jgi:hypothetical protein
MRIWGGIVGVIFGDGVCGVYVIFVIVCICNLM